MNDKTDIQKIFQDFLASGLAAYIFLGALVAGFIVGMASPAGGFAFLALGCLGAVIVDYMQTNQISVGGQSLLGSSRSRSSSSTGIGGRGPSQS